MENSVVTPNVDFSKVEAINQKRTLAFINHWVLHTVAFLNQFSALCEEKLIALETKIRRADHTLAILEAKLSSVPDLEGVVASPVVSASSQEAPSVATNPVAAEEAATTPANNDEITTQPTSTTVAPTEPEGHDVVDAAPPQPPTKPISEDPRFAHYFRMLKMGVPEPAVRMKMSSEGVDPALLDDPSAPAPPSAAITNANQDSDSDSSWSD